jgi:DNA-binding HxlR family transcriptional regulator
MDKPLRFEACSVARTLDVIGDYWTFLILRECFFGVRRFDAFAANIGIATNILSLRLRKLTSYGILERFPDPEDGRRYEYRLTAKGLAIYPQVLALIRWGDQWMGDGEGPPLTLIHRGCGKPFVPTMCCSCCGKPVDAHNVDYRERPRKKASPAIRSRRRQPA